MSLKKQIPNSITLLRLLAAFFVFWAICQKNFGLALSFYLFALITDAFDGYLARKWKVESFIGGEVLEIISDGSLIFLSISALVLIKTFPLSILLLMSVGAVIFLIYTRKSKSEAIKSLTIIIQFFGYAAFNLGIVLCLALKISIFTTILSLGLLSILAYIKRKRIYFAFTRGSDFFLIITKKT